MGLESDPHIEGSSRFKKTPLCRKACWGSIIAYVEGVISQMLGARSSVAVE